MFPLPCVLFAGGKSSRMGQDKALLPFGEAPTLAQFQYDRLSRLFQHVAISTKTADKFAFDAPFILDPPDVDYAPTAGFVSAFDHLNEERIMVISIDTPFIDATIFQALLDADEPSRDAVIATTQSGSHPMVGIYHRSLVPAFEKMLLEKDHRLGKLLHASHTRYVPFEDETLFANLNHPHEYENALSRYNLIHLSISD
ncbi:MAG: molybdenum cofactor guanylyltransferase MobA [Sulfuricurvum sp.]